jgi:hypothetical protein
MLAIATTSLKAMFIGIETVFRSRGGRVSDLGMAMKWFYWASFRVRCKMDYPFWCSSRPFLDKVVREFFFEHYADSITVLTRRRIVDPVLSTDLPALLADPAKQDATKTGVPVSGFFTNAATTRADSDEFRVAGVHIKRRPDEAASCGVEGVYDTLATATTAAEHSAQEYTTSVRIPRPAVEHDEEYVLGDLVVDCSGASALAAKWAASKWGLSVPHSEIKATSMYVSHIFQEPEGFEADWICAPVYPTPGLSSKFGYVMRVEKGLWQVTGMATAGETVDNKTLAGFESHFADLDHPLIHDLLRAPAGARPVPVAGEKLHTYFPKVYVRRHFEDCPAMPEGLVAVGNSLCVFDPMYGQGMSGACIAALALNRALLQPEFRGAAGASANGLARAYFSVAADRLAFPWMLCAGEDSRWAPRIRSTGPASPEQPNLRMRCLKFWIRQGMILAEKHPLAQATAMGIMNMTLSFTALLNPPLVWLVLKNVALEALGQTETPEQRYRREIEPARAQRLLKIR